MRPELAESLSHLQDLALRAKVEPVLFGTAVLELMGIGDFRATDLDVIVGIDEAVALAAAAGIDPGGEGGNDRFRSAVHLHVDHAPLVIDVMACMRVRAAERWVLYEPAETVRIEVEGRQFCVVSLADLRRFYCLAGRAKDRPKIAALDAALA